VWELIRANKRKSWIVFILMGITLVLLGYVIGAAFLPPDGGLVGVILALLVWFFLSLLAYFSGDSILLGVSKAKEITKDVHPQLFNIVEEMKIASGLPAMPKVYVIDERAPNAFATGRKAEKSAVAVTAGLLARLNRDELQGVVAHEMSHIMNRDVQFVTFAGVLMGSIVLISEVFLRGLWFSGGSSRRYRSKSKGGGQAQAIILLVAVAFAILAPIMARLLYFALSRKREYLADASAARLTRYPEGLASALERISENTYELKSANKVTAPMYIVNPLKKKGMKLSNLTSTHPPITDRVHILRGMMHGAGYADYQTAYAAVRGGAAPLLPPSALKDKERVVVRKPSVKKEAKPDKKKDARAIGDLIRATNRYMFLACVCGLKLKLPPDFDKEELSCPRCGRTLEVPLAKVAAVATALGAADAVKKKQAAKEKPAVAEKPPAAREQEDGPQLYVRTGTGWETFSCSCGRPIQLSPLFQGTHLACPSCGRKTEIRAPEATETATA
jgi:heat shock protein HtpX